MFGNQGQMPTVSNISRHKLGLKTREGGWYTTGKVFYQLKFASALGFICIYDIVMYRESNEII